MGRAQFEYRDERYRNLMMALAGLLSDISTGTCSSSAVTINDHFGMVTTEALTTAQNAIETITVTNDKVAATSTLHRNTASRRKSRLAKRLQALKKGPATG